MRPRNTSFAIGIESTAPSSDADCAPSHSGQAYCTSLALAERLCRTADRITPARVRRPFRRLGRGASTPNPEKPMLAITMRSERTGHWIKMRRSLADFITTTSGFRFSVHTAYNRSACSLSAYARRSSAYNRSAYSRGAYARRCSHHGLA